MPSPTDLLPLGPRYQGAWAEVSARLQSRQLVNLSFATAVVTACAAIIGTMHPTVEDRWPPVLSIALVILSWIYALWIRNNDAMVGLLGAHNQACEVFADPDNLWGVPAWFSERQLWIKQARKYRELSDLAGIWLCVLSALPALAVGVMTLWQNPWLAVFLLGFGAFGMAAARYVHGNKAIRTSLSRARFEKTRDGWELFIPGS